ncbi:MAG: tRNA uridine(34) 5-carboxymethylaminomethyl modification radical SAM/GNAT enzyme Elp3 [Candidatus Altiarchaeales archaeon]|nr:MAG: tRNA uridine(34) 5-carboxymethylaminomethyl modification radical SAM/GNAT enzyme Elp3 [Candidatus Altiarchaeales archaeon]RLI94311.1 MAG: tRNA uridine(34) 5-carboxymethylaminomethyl modification radical SAM/GNAT enzyme Elp3 [Candidatus Altiarchaeales archaeon]RLI94636.1 MAG: tRNA uridine(34) 5-carboxymethylaminomethyl modification radical SAM/GNAT enzyme Elp3 [Candidatus Altiarchaeales archaeon]HDO82044.1 tRNA uridine(34) 5-carboxymethylaminomethyl modification radical SAM/GNAT enzyme El
MERFCRKIIERILSGKIKTKEDLNREKRNLALEFGINGFIRNSEILKYVRSEERDKVLRVLQKKPTRTISGVAVVAVMTHPMPCPHGKCKYCPGGPEIDVPQSYTGKEPATRRAISYGYDPYLQVTFRLRQLKEIGHPISKVELIVMGGTLTAQCIDYQEWFVKEALRAMNEFLENYEKINEIGEENFIEEYKSKKLGRRFKYLEEIQKENEKSYVKCVGMTFEPRPDWAKKDEINEMLRFGVTRVEIGVQNPSDRIYKMVDRGHTVRDVIEATQLLKDSGLKVSYHLMPGILGYKPKIDLDAFKKVFDDQRFRPDMVKIYPCLVLRGTQYYELWREGKFKPITTEEAIDLIIKIKQRMPKWVRTMRIMRDIPSQLIVSGIKESNLGELVYREMDRRGIRCRCIRCREVGHSIRRGIEPDEDNIELLREDYLASNGNEIFLSFEDTKNDILIGFLRLRIPYKPFRREIDERTALIRELHIYGPMVEVGEKPLYEWQHRGYGRELLEEAEKISKEEFDMKRILVTSGIGARDYYRKFNYRMHGVYMGKTIE